MATPYGGNNLYNPSGRGDLSADDYNYLQTQRRQIRQQYGLGLAQNAFERNSAKANFLRQRQNVAQAWGQRFPGFQQGYAERGLLNSGLYGKGYDEFRAARNADMGDLLGAYNEKIGALRLANQQLGQVYRSSIDDIASLGAARRASVAEELRRARQGL